MSRRWRTRQSWSNSNRQPEAPFLRCKENAPNLGRFLFVANRGDSFPRAKRVKIPGVKYPWFHLGFHFAVENARSRTRASVCAKGDGPAVGVPLCPLAVLARRSRSIVVCPTPPRGVGKDSQSLPGKDRVGTKNSRARNWRRGYLPKGSPHVARGLRRGSDEVLNVARGCP